MFIFADRKHSRYSALLQQNNYSIMIEIFAANNLLDKTINGWKVIEKLPKPSLTKGETGGNFSIGYIVEKENQQCFMKVLDFERIFMNNPTLSTSQAMQIASEEFNYEKALSEYCRNKHVSKVVYYIDSGEITVPGFAIGTVSYIIYEKAQGDIRKTLDFSKKIELSAKLKSLSIRLESLHDVAVGINQLHNSSVSHQDIKPSNIMVFEEESKLGDLGRSICMSPEVKYPFAIEGFTGDNNYAPPEVFFHYHLPDVKQRLYQMDNYMLGSLVFFYITGVSLNARLNEHLPISIIEMLKQGMHFEEALAYLQNAFNEVLNEFKEEEILIDEIKEGIVQIVGYLCNPDPNRRGHPKSALSADVSSKYNLERTIQELDLMQKKAEIAINKL